MLDRKINYLLQMPLEQLLSLFEPIAAISWGGLL
jgi:hypothetical protein